MTEQRRTTDHQKNTYEKNKAIKNGVSRFVVTALVVLADVLLIQWLVYSLYARYLWFSTILRVLTLLLVLVIYGQHKTASLKMPWIMLMLVEPIIGITIYLVVGLNSSTNRMRARYRKIDEKLLPLLPDNEAEEEALRALDPYAYRVTEYVERCAQYPVYRNTRVTYYDEAYKGLEAQLEALRGAQKFIFMEYHAIEQKESFERILEVLVDRVQAGVEVRLFYDDMGSIGFINTDFVKRMKALGIRCRVFNPFAPALNFFLNNRDHRKITVIDGRIGFTGGYNIADEYFNITHPYGYWKDTGIRIEGDAVRNLTITFLENWNAVKMGGLMRRKTYDAYIEEHLSSEHVEQYLPEVEVGNAAMHDGFVQPYADQPMDDEPVGENVYISIAEQAVDYVWFVTPYLIITDEMIRTFSLAAKRGVDVRIITPGIPDKKIIYSVTRSYYNALVRNGVRIFEYTPGFTHAKMCVCDDRIATCGTINLDYRSFYHHFENGCILAHCDAVGDIRKDFEHMFADCRDVTENYRIGRSQSLRLSQMVLRLIAPLM